MLQPPPRERRRTRCANHVSQAQSGVRSGALAHREEVAIHRALIDAFFRLQCILLIPPLRVLLRTNAIGPRVRREPGKGLILAANHQSWVDPYAVQVAVLPHRITFLMTELFFDLPVAGTYFRLSGARRVREEGAPSVTGFRAARDVLNEGEVVCLFPEGELTLTGEIGRGQRGVARLARRTGAPILPIGIHGAINVFSKLQKTPRRRPIRVRRGALMHYDEAPDKEGEERFMQRLMARIASLAE